MGVDGIMYCGIDVSKNKSNVCILDEKFEVVKEFEVEHNKQGFEKLAKYLTKNIKIAMEVTGNYSKIIYEYLKSRNFKVIYVEGVQMANIARYQSPTIKNDKVDAKLLAKAFSFPDLKEVVPSRMNELKDLCKLYHKTANQVVKHVGMYKDQLNIIFPEIEEKMYRGYNIGITNILFKYPAPRLIAITKDEELLETMKTNTGKGSGNFTIEKVRKIKELAKESIGVKDYPTEYFRYVIKTMLHYVYLKRDLKNSLDEALKTTPYYKLTDTYGLSTISVATIVGEIEDIRRFPTYKKFISYCGFGIYENMSGTSVNKSSRLSKRGNSILRKTFYQLVLTNLSYKTEVYNHYMKLKKRGKHSKKCLVATARKIAIRTYFDMIKCHK